MDKLTVQQAAEKWNTSVRNVQALCKRGRIAGAERVGRDWLIPADAERPKDGRRKEAKAMQLQAPAAQPLIRKTPFLDMTNLYSTPGTADSCVEALSAYPEAQALFAAEIAYSRGNIDQVLEQANYFLESHTGLYAVLSGGLLLSLCAMWKGDLQLWYRARQHILEAPCSDAVGRDILSLALASADSAIRNTNDFPDWFIHGCFDNLPRDAHPAARVYYVKYLLYLAQDLAQGSIALDGMQGLSMMKMLPYIIEPMISQMVVDHVIMAEIYLRLLCAIAYHQCGEDTRGTIHLDKAIQLCLADGLYAPLVEHRLQLGSFLDDRLAQTDPNALQKVKELHKQLHSGRTKLQNAVLHKTVQISLSIREREVARLASFGMSDRQIAMQLHLSESSVKGAIRTAKNKTGVNSRAELAVYI